MEKSETLASEMLSALKRKSMAQTLIIIAEACAIAILMAVVLTK